MQNDFQCVEACLLSTARMIEDKCRKINNNTTSLTPPKKKSEDKAASQIFFPLRTFLSFYRETY